MLFLPIRISGYPHSGEIQTNFSGGLGIVTDLEYYSLGQTVSVRIGTAHFSHSIWRSAGGDHFPPFPGAIGEMVTFKDVVQDYSEPSTCIFMTSIETDRVLKPIQDESEKS